MKQNMRFMNDSVSSRQAQVHQNTRHTISPMVSKQFLDALIVT